MKDYQKTIVLIRLLLDELEEIIEEQERRIRKDNKIKKGEN